MYPPGMPYREHLILAARASAGAAAQRDAGIVPWPPFTAPLPGSGWHPRALSPFRLPAPRPLGPGR